MSGDSKVALMARICRRLILHESNVQVNTGRSSPATDGRTCRGGSLLWQVPLGVQRSLASQSDGSHPDPFSGADREVIRPPSASIFRLITSTSVGAAVFRNAPFCETLC
jgi:hypothetical protein